MLETTDRYKLEYSEVGNLRRHYSAVRSGLTTFCLTAALVAFANYLARDPHPQFFAFVAGFMLVAAMLACFVFSWRCERANLYMRDLWNWFDGPQPDTFVRFDDFAPKRTEMLRQMFADEMNWVLLAALVSIGGAFYKFG
jgi:hypothetical protein